MSTHPSPFACPEPGCSQTYSNKSHLTRHLAKHQARTYPCPHCDTTFTRKDSLRKHIQLRHQDTELHRARAPAACVRCKGRKTRCDGAMPCSFCLQRGFRCKYEIRNAEKKGLPSGSLIPPNPSSDCGQWSRDVYHHVEVYFKHFHPTWPFLHKATFSPGRELPVLVQSVVMIGLWTSGEQHARDAAIEMYLKLRHSVKGQRAVWDISEAEGGYDGTPWPIGTYQGILLGVIFALMVNKHDRAHQIPNFNPEVLIALVKSCLKRGMFNHHKMLAQYDQPDPDPFTALYIWTGVEEAKRFALSLYQVWRIYRDDAMEGNDDEDLLPYSQLQFPMPTCDYMWDAESEADLVRRTKEECEKGNRPCEREKEWICDGPPCPYLFK
ncbi:uncharacterized protein K452DRAFT_237366 [Aplosporella prunicola CBS 121167]|uniref:C2H2-type domain-containing protein n=1 Tax=Aplosporella prunicola CBS 121167 TaxID=1176127 RepID=A0A6A6AY07_9PEZI|nr:uncharacterized protein K452DRAFT_237366 [Aplosporella prunicola CBS 121167]KAF2136486.1 hypothetical protein K452DRAFT_237366 [Aplosporella prunicola CBS 121167]